ncbi:MAG: hypothetical protein H0W09_08205 [Solirubrobacterales bacterium]|nr:hypothetical protein [Solirubrobacterales bacterium]
MPPERPKRERPAASGRLSEAWARRIAAVLLVIGAVIVALAIADVGPFSDPPTESERARDTVVGFFAAASQGEWGEFCSRLTTDAREQVQANVSELTGREAKGCVEALSVGGSGSFAGLSLRIKSVRIIGNQGRVEAVVKLPEEPPEPRSILLLQDEGVWLINDPD